MTVVGEQWYSAVSFQHLLGPGPVPSSGEDSTVLPGQSQGGMSRLSSGLSLFVPLGCIPH